MLNKRAAAMIATWLVAVCAHAAQPIPASNEGGDEVIDVAFKSVSVIAFLNEVVPAGYKVSYERPDLATRTISSHGRGVWHRLLPYTGAQSGIAMRADLANKTVYVTAVEMPAADKATKRVLDKPSAPGSRQAEPQTAAQLSPPAPLQVAPAQPVRPPQPAVGDPVRLGANHPQPLRAAAPSVSSSRLAAQTPQASGVAKALGQTAAAPIDVPRAAVQEQPRELALAPNTTPAPVQIQRALPSIAPPAPKPVQAPQEVAQKQTVAVPIAQVAPEPVVKVTAPAPQKPVWKIRKGEPIHEALVDWADKSDWTLIWYPSVSWKAIGDVVMDEQPDVVAAVSEVVTILRAEGKPIQLRVSDGNNVMEVLATEVKND